MKHTTRRLHLIDARHIDQAYRLKREVGQPQLVQEQPVVVPGHMYGSVLRDNEQFRMWYLVTRRIQGKLEGLPDLDKSVYCEYYATSEDGIRWQQPPLHKLPQHAGLRDVVELPEAHAFLGSGQMDGAGRELCGLSGPEGFCIIDATMTPHPLARGRYTAMYLSSLGEGLTPGYSGGPTGGLCFAWSDNGVDWNAYEHNPVIKGWMDTSNCFFYDARISKYVIYGRPNVFPQLGSKLSNRTVARAESEDLIHWTPYKTVLDTDERDADPFDFIDEAERHRYWDRVYDTVRKKEYPPSRRGKNRQFYGIVVYPYHDMYVGLAQMYDIASGEMWLELCHSYDGIDWKREPVPVPFIAPRKGHWDQGSVVSAAASPPVSVGDELYIYYTGCTANHHQTRLPIDTVTAIGLRKMKRDRYVGYRAAEEEGELITVPLAPAAKLYLNAEVKQDGYIRVELFGPHNERIDGFTLDDCEPLTAGDELAREVRYAGGKSLAQTGYATVRLRIRSRRATVYGLEWAE